MRSKYCGCLAFLLASMSLCILSHISGVWAHQLTMEISWKKVHWENADGVIIISCRKLQCGFLGQENNAARHVKATKWKMPVEKSWPHHILIFSGEFSLPNTNTVNVKILYFQFCFATAHRTGYSVIQQECDTSVKAPLQLGFLSLLCFCSCCLETRPKYMH